MSPSSIPLKKVAAFISLAFSSAMMLCCGVFAYYSSCVNHCLLFWWNNLK
jgi:hypothetical protein